MEKEEVIKDLRLKAKKLNFNLCVLFFIVICSCIIGGFIITRNINQFNPLISMVLIYSIFFGIIIVIFTFEYYAYFLDKLERNNLSLRNYLKINRNILKISKGIYLIISPFFIFVLIDSLINTSLAYFTLVIFILITIILIPICDQILYKHILNKFGLLMEKENEYTLEKEKLEK